MRTPSRAGQCDGPYRVQLDKVGAMIIWCKDTAGKTVSSHEYVFPRAVRGHAAHLDRGQGRGAKRSSSTLERRGGRAVITDVR